MLPIIIWIVWITVFIVALTVLIKGADYFTESSESIGKALKIPQFIVGVVIVSIGTSLPELITSLFAIHKGTTEFVAGNVIGSNVANILLVLGITAIYAKKLKIEWDIIKIDAPILIAGMFLLIFFGWDGEFTFIEAIFSLIGYLIYLEYSYATNRESADGTKREKLGIKSIIILILSSIAIFFGAKYTIEAVIKMTELFGFADTSFIALTVVAIGTSLPELMASLSAAKRKNYELVIGNILGSNIFNGFVVMGIPGLIKTLEFSSSIIIIGLPFLFAATFMYVISTLDKEVSRFEGAIFLLIYAVFIGKIYGLF